MQTKRTAKGGQSSSSAKAIPGEDLSEGDEIPTEVLSEGEYSSRSEAMEETKPGGGSRSQQQRWRNELPSLLVMMARKMTLMRLQVRAEPKGCTVVKPTESCT